MPRLNWKKYDFYTLFKYIFTGGMAFVLDFGLLYLFVSIFRLPAGPSAAAAVIIATLFSYLTQKYFTFKQRKQVASSALKYLILLVGNTLVTALVVQIFQSFLGLYLVGKIIVTAMITLWNYPLMKRWVYK